VGTKYVAPGITLKSFNCPRCGALAAQRWFEVWCDPIAENKPPMLSTHEWVSKVKSEGIPDVQTVPQDVITLWGRMADGDVMLQSRQYGNQCGQILENIHVSLCHSCNEISLWRYDTVLFPLRRYEIEPNDDMNNDIRMDFDEARAILDISPRGAAALLRLCIQKLCKQLGKTGKNLNEDIASLVKDGLDPDVQRALDVVRVVGNEAVHPGEMDLRDGRATAATLFELVNYIAEDRITRPKKVAALYSTIPASAVAAIEKRDGATT